MYNPFSLENKTILVTGASSGIGKATAVECAKLGATVIATARNEKRLQEVFDSLDISFGQQHQMIIADLSTDEGITDVVATVPALDGVASNAGIVVELVPIKFLKDDVMRQTLEVNTLSHAKLARDLFKKKKLNKGASYVFTSSVGGVNGFAVGNSAYGMSKAAVNAFSKYCAVDFATRGIRCNAVCPGMIKTPMTAPTGEMSEDDYKADIEKHYLLGRYGEPEEVARTIIFLLSDASSFITGVSIMIDGGYSVSH